MDRVDLAAGDEVAQGEERRDRQEALDAGRARADEASGLEAVHPAHELPSDKKDGQEESGLDEVSRPLDALPAGSERRALQDVGGGDGVQADEVASLAQGGAGEPGEERGDHRGHSTGGSSRVA